MKRPINLSRACALLIVLIGTSAAGTSAQTYNAYSGGYNTGYGTVYGSFGLAMATQNMYQYSQMQMQRAMARAAMVKQFGLAAVEKAEREAAAGKAPAANGPRVAPPPVVRNYGVFRPDASVDTAKALADALGETPEEKQLIRTIYTATKTAYEKEAAAKGIRNNIAGAMAFFTGTAMMVYDDRQTPSDDAVLAYYKVVNAAIDEMPEFASVSNKDKQGFHNMLIGFAGLLTAGYLEGKETENTETLAAYKQIAGMLIQMVLKAEPSKLRLVDGQIVLG